VCVWRWCGEGRDVLEAERDLGYRDRELEGRVHKLERYAHTICQSIRTIDHLTPTQKYSCFE
jgi:hypothetical protein